MNFLIDSTSVSGIQSFWTASMAEKSKWVTGLTQAWSTALCIGKLKFLTNRLLPANIKTLISFLDIREYKISGLLTPQVLLLTDLTPSEILHYRRWSLQNSPVNISESREFSSWQIWSLQKSLVDRSDVSINLSLTDLKSSDWRPAVNC